MRPITYGEKQRIKDQALTRMYGASEVAFKIEYFAYYDTVTGDLQPDGESGGTPVTYTWWEEGFYGDFSLNSKNTSVDQSANQLASLIYFAPAFGMGLGSPAWRGSTQGYRWETEIGATISFPIEYSEGFVTKGGFGTHGHGRPFRFELTGDLTLVHDTVYCREVWIKSLHGEPFPAGIPNVYTIEADSGDAYLAMQRGVATLDAWVYRLRSEIQTGSRSSLGQPSASKRGAGVIDAAGHLSDRKDTKFIYKTVGDLRRLGYFDIDEGG
jgi:hypothetical protein